MRRRWKKAAVMTLTVVLGSIVFAALTAVPVNADGTFVAGNKNCSDLIAGSQELRINAPADGTFTDGTLTVVIDVRAATFGELLPHTALGGSVFDFTASGGSVTGVAVKGGPNTNFYDYRPNGVTSGTGLHAPKNPSNNQFYGLSHISFCYVPKVTPTIVTQVSSAEITLGQSVTDTATLSGGNNPTGTISFQVFGPDDATCSGLNVFTTGNTAKTVNGNGNYTSDPFTPTLPGTYRWIASYSGDVNNNAVTTACNDANESVLVSKAPSAISTDPWIYPNDKATVSAATGQTDITGSVTFRLYDTLANCQANGGTVATGLLYSESVNLPAATATFKTVNTSNTTVKIEVDKVVFWRVEYSGDANHAGRLSNCVENIDVDLTGDAGPGTAI